MKKIIVLTIICLSVYVNSFSQQLTTIKDIATVTLPNNAEKLTKEKLAALKPKNGKVTAVSYEHSKGDSYKTKDFLVQLNAASIAPRPGFLEQLKMELDELYSFAQPRHYNTSIKRFMNHSAVITYYENPTDDKAYFFFSSYNRNGDSVVVGTLEFDKSNRATAEKDLDEIIKSIKFKK